MSRFLTHRRSRPTQAQLTHKSGSRKIVFNILAGSVHYPCTKKGQGKGKSKKTDQKQKGSHEYNAEDKDERAQKAGSVQNILFNRNGGHYQTVGNSFTLWILNCQYPECYFVVLHLSVKSHVLPAKVKYLFLSNSSTQWTHYSLMEIKTLTVRWLRLRCCRRPRCHTEIFKVSQYGRRWIFRQGWGLQPVMSNKNVSGYHKKSIDHPHLA